VENRAEGLAEAGGPGARIRDLVVLARNSTGFSRRRIARTISTYSRVFTSGLPKGCPCQPSTTCGPDTPSPIRNRPPASASSVIAVIAAIAGVRPAICMMAVPTWMRSVRAAIQAAGVTASEP